MTSDTALNGTAKVSLDLDALEREGAPGPFSIRHGGREYVFADAQELDWQKLILALGNPHQFFRLTLTPEDAKEFMATPMASWKMRRLMGDYRDHYGLVDPGEAAALPG